LMSAAQTFATVGAATAECVISNVAQSAAAHVNGFMSNVLPCSARIRAHFMLTPVSTRIVLEHDADGGLQHFGSLFAIAFAGLLRFM
jgi:hypothetical protein